MPEFGVYQDVDLAAGQSFTNEAAAKAWLDAFLDNIAKAKAGPGCGVAGGQGGATAPSTHRQKKQGHAA